MITQSIFQAGNSTVVAIPKQLARQLNLRVGQKVTVDRLGDSSDIVIRTRPKTKEVAKTDKSRKEFKKWVSMFLKEDEGLLKELAKR